MYRGTWPLRRGFTLIELLVVIALLGFVAATVTVRLGGRLGYAALSQAVSQWEFTDGQLRDRARRKGKSVTLHLEIGSNQLEYAFDPEDDSAQTTRSLGRGVKLTRFRSAAREVTYGPVQIEYSAHGATETYVVEFESSQGKRRILVAGLTGQLSELVHEKEVEELLDKLLPTSVHAG